MLGNRVVKSPTDVAVAPTFVRAPLVLSRSSSESKKPKLATREKRLRN